jgi:hypothetical protein
MKKRLNIIALTLTTGLLLGMAAPVMAEEEAPSADMSVGIYSDYIWRGWQFSEDSIVVQPSLTVGYKGFAFNMWGNLDLDEHEEIGGADAESSSWNETDLTLSYDASCDFADYGVGWIYYAVDGAQDTQEIYATATLSTILSPSVTVYRDIDAIPGWYVTAGISHSFPLTETLSLELGAQVGYLSVDDEDDLADPSDATDNYSAFHDGVLSASISIPVNDYLTITPELYYSFPLSSEAEDLFEADNDYDGDAVADGDEDIIYGGVSISFAF